MGTQGLRTPLMALVPLIVVPYIMPPLRSLDYGSCRASWGHKDGRKGGMDLSVDYGFN